MIAPLNLRHPVNQSGARAPEISRRVSAQSFLDELIIAAIFVFFSAGEGWGEREISTKGVSDGHN